MPQYAIARLRTEQRIDGQPPDQHEAATAHQFLANRVEDRAERRQTKVFPVDAGDCPVAGVDRLDRGGDLVDFGLAQNMNPVVALVHRVGAPRVGAGNRSVRASG